MRRRIDCEVQRQSISAYNSAGRVKHVDVTRTVGFGMKGPLNTKRSIVATFHQLSSRAMRREAEHQFRFPSRRRTGN
jgi:hypothetical protein